MTIQINDTIINSVKNYSVNSAEISVFFNNDCRYSEKEIASLLKLFANYGFAMHYKDNIFGTDAIVAIGNKDMQNIDIQVVE